LDLEILVDTRRIKKIMNIEKIDHKSILDRENQINGLIFGVFGGLWFALGVWGLDALLLSSAQTENAGLKLLIGAPFVILLGGIIGWLTARFDRPVLGGLFWLLTGLIFGWFASHIPFEGLSLVIGYLDVEFSGSAIYPFVYSAQMRMILIMVLIGVILAFAGGFELFFIESASHASSQSGRFFRLFSCFIIFLPIGLLVDNLINNPLRAPMIGLSRTINLARDARNQGMSLDAKRAAGVRVLDIFGNTLDQPYKLILGTYDADSIQETTIYINFSGVWGVCSAVEDKTIVCWKATERYLRKLDCVINGGSFNFCGLKLLPDSTPPDMSIFKNYNPVSLRYGIEGARGNTVLVTVGDGDEHQSQCRMRDEGNVFLESCSAIQKSKVELERLPPTPTRPAPTPKATLFPGQVAESIQAPAMIVPGLLRQPVLDDATVYTITLDLADDLLSFDGRSQVEVTNNETVTLDSLYFHLLPNGKSSYGNGSLTVNRVEMAGKKVKTELSVDDSVLRVPLEKPLKPTETVLVGFYFSGQVPKDFGGSVTPAGYGIYNYTDGLLALSGWYPMLSVYDDQGWHNQPPSRLGDSVFSDISLFTVDVDAPKNLVIAATGVAVSDETIDSRRKMRFASGPAREFFLVASGDLQVASQTMGETKINSYYRIDQSEAGRKALSVAAASFHIFRSKFGDYPLKELDIVEAPIRNALGVEFPGIVMIGAEQYLKPDDTGFEITVSHEVAHQWWYNVVGNDVYREPWLDEALATYSSGIYYELMNGPVYLRGLEDYWKQSYQKIADQGKDDLITETLEHFENLADPSIYGAIVYRKGALFFAALREEIGDKAFFEALKTYYASESYRIAQASDLLSAFEKASGKNLETFYRMWLFSQ
jgi:hypothetical protein